MRAASVLLEPDAGAVRRARERAGDVPIGLVELEQEIARPRMMGAWRVACQRLAAVGYSGQRLIVHRDQRGGVFREVTRLRDHHCDRFADEGDLVLRQNKRSDVGRQLRGTKLQGESLLRQERLEIGKGEHRAHPRRAARRFRVDRANARVPVRAAHECRLQHVRKAQVGDEAAVASEQRPILEPLDGMADVTAARHFFCRPLAERGPIGSG